MNLTEALGFLMILSGALAMWQWRAARSFRFAGAEPPPTGGADPVTVFKPLKGVDAETESCLRSWLLQEYAGERQILFGVASRSDPVCDLVRRLLREYPTAGAELAICGETLGTNAKVSTLIQLERRARHEIVVIADADVRVSSDFLARVVGELTRGDAALVSCFYTLANPVGGAMRWEAVAVNADFWSQVLQARALGPIDFALGATMATTRRQVERIGGFRVLADYLADDYQLGRRIVQAGGTLAISGTVVGCWMGRMTWPEVWFHQLRWARTIRASRPFSYFFSILGNATLWPLLYCGVSWLSGGGFPGGLMGVCVAGCWALRVGSAVDLQWRLARDADAWKYAPMVVVKDLLQTGVWIMAFLGNRVTWRGERYDVLQGGKLVGVGTSDFSEGVADKPLLNS